MNAKEKIKAIFDNTPGDTERQIKLLKLVEHYYWLAALLGGMFGVCMTGLFHAMLR